jgi:hypothetical protein
VSFPFNAVLSIVYLTLNLDILSFDQVSRSIRENGGEIAALDDPKLTHVVVDKRDDSRRLTLMQRTSR